MSLRIQDLKLLLEAKARQRVKDCQIEEGQAKAKAKKLQEKEKDKYRHLKQIHPQRVFSPSKIPKFNGRDWEMEFFGVCGDDHKPQYGSKTPWRTCYQVAKRLQDLYRWNPKRPSTLVGRWLFEDVRTLLRPGIIQNLMLYCSVGSKCDTHHAADGFFTVAENKTSGQVSRILQIDLTTFLDGKVEQMIIGTHVHKGACPWPLVYVTPERVLDPAQRYKLSKRIAEFLNDKH